MGKCIKISIPKFWVKYFYIYIHITVYHDKLFFEVQIFKLIKNCHYAYTVTKKNSKQIEKHLGLAEWV